MLRAHHAERPLGLGRTPMNVPVVDAFVDMRRIIRNLLAQIGFSSVDEAKDGSEALAKLKPGDFGVDGFVLKPFNGLTLQQKINSVVSAQK